MSPINSVSSTVPFKGEYSLGERQVKVRKLRGNKKKLCRQCNKVVKLTEQHTGRLPGIDTGGEPFTIFINEIYGSCGHVVEDWSH